MKKRLLLTGGSGLLALNWACAMRETHDIVLAVHHHDVRLEGTVTRRLVLENDKRLAEELAAMRPDIIVHAAALANVDECERDPTRAWITNVEVASNVAAAAAQLGVSLVHVSTDHLFDGESSYYSEDAVPCPLNEYARTKLVAEEQVLQRCPNALVVRTNFFGWGTRERRSFSDWIIDRLRAGERTTMFDDVFVTPILLDALAVIVHRLLDVGASGVFNVVGDDRLSKYQFGMLLASEFELPSMLIVPKNINASSLTARRPRDMSLDNRKLRAKLGTAVGIAADFLKALKQQQADGRRDELLRAVSSVIHRA